MQFHLESWRNELLSLHHHNNTNASENLPMLFQSINLVNALWLKIIDQFPWQVCWRSLWSVSSINISWSSWLIIFCWVRASMLLEKLVHESLNFFSCYTHGSVLSRKVIQSMWSSWVLQKPSTGSLIITYFISCNVMAIAFGCFPGFMTICQTVHKESLLEVIHQIGWRCPQVFLKGVYWGHFFSSCT